MTACPTWAHIFPFPILSSPLTTNNILLLENGFINISAGFGLISTFSLLLT